MGGHCGLDTVYSNGFVQLRTKNQQTTRQYRVSFSALVVVTRTMRTVDFDNDDKHGNDGGFNDNEGDAGPYQT